MKYMKLAAVLAIPTLLSGCGLLVHTASCVVTITVVC